MNERNSPCYVARCKCTALRAAVVDDGEYREDMSEDVAEWIRDGLVVERTTSAAVREADWCCTCERPNERRATGLFRVRATVEFVVYSTGEEEDAEEKVRWELPDIIREGGMDDPRLRLSPVQGLSDLPAEWNADSLPFLGDGERTVGEIVASASVASGGDEDDDWDAEDEGEERSPTEADLEAAGQARLF